MGTRGQTDFERVDDDAELARQEAIDPDLQGIPRDWYKHARLETGIPITALDAAIARGLSDADAGRVKPLQEVADRLSAKYRNMAIEE